MSKRRRFNRGITCIIALAFVATFAADSAEAANRKRVWGWSQSNHQRQGRFFSSQRTHQRVSTPTRSSRSYRSTSRRSVSSLPNDALPFYYFLGGPTNYSVAGH
ncbi:MAG: hypothetical protein AAF745_03590 [Planctomycetota bacterium]